MSQSVTPEQIKYGYQCFYRCEKCHRNVYENYQWLGSTFLIEHTEQNKSKCPYCHANIDFNLLAVDTPTDITPGVLRFPSKDYAFVFKTDQSILTTITIQVKGSIGEPFEVNFGDGNKIIIILTGANQVILHDYRKENVYFIKIFCKENILTNFRCYRSRLISYMPTPNTQVNLTQFGVNNNGLTGTIPPLTSMTKLHNMYFHFNGLSGTIPSMDDCEKAIYFTFHNNNLSGIFPSIDRLTSLMYLSFQNNQISGSIPSLTQNVNLRFILCQFNNLTGSIPSLNNNTLMTQIRCNDNQISGVIPSLTQNVNMQKFFIWNNAIIGYTASTLAISLNNFRAQNNLLTSTAVNQILADFATNLTSRPVSGKILIDGTGNQAPTGQGITDKNLIIAHGWTVLTN